MDYIEVEAETAEEARGLAMEKGRQLHPRKSENSGPQGSSTEPFLNGGDYQYKEPVPNDWKAIQ